MSAFVHRAIARAQDRGWIVWAVEYKQNQCLIGNFGFDESNVEVGFGWRFAQQYWGPGPAYTTKFRGHLIGVPDFKRWPHAKKRKQLESSSDILASYRTQLTGGM